MTLAEYRKRKGIEPVQPEDSHGAAHAERHPGPLEYAQIGAILAVITAIEVAIYYVGLSQTALVAVLFVLSLLKFTLVVLWFMHLKFDDRRFSRFFMMGLALAATLYLVVLISFRVFLG